jgi:uncharacterized SAM-binding protein YcdF (DUF218 family)
MNELLIGWGLQDLKRWGAFLLLPPVPWLLLALAGGWQMARRRVLGWSLLLAAVAGLWLSATGGAADVLRQALLRPPPPLDTAALAPLRRAPDTAIVVLGGGRRETAPEYGMATLTPLSIERLRYALWLSRETQLPVAMSGGVAPGAPAGASEAEIGARIAAREFGRPLRWVEGESRDTRENALRTAMLLKGERITRIVLVTHDFHMRRAVRNFERAAARAGWVVQIVPAPMGVPAPGPMTLGDWLPSLSGARDTGYVLREWLGWLAGA